MKFLVTGGAGFIGANFIHYWLKNHPDDQIVNLDAETYAANHANLRKIESNINYIFIKGNICNRVVVDQAMKGVDKVVHFAAESIPGNIYIPINSNTGTRMLTFEELWNEQKKKNPACKTEKGEAIFIRGKQTKTLSFLNGGQWMPVKAITRHYYKGKIVKLAQKWGIIEATPNHSIYSANLALSNPQDNPELLVVRQVNEHKRKFKAVDKKLLTILAAYITEGNATFNKANGAYIVEIGQKDRLWLESLGKIIKVRFGCNFSISKGRKGKFTFFHLQISNKRVFSYLKKTCGQYCDGKFFPNWIFDLPAVGREFFWNKLLEGDGTKDGRYTTTSPKLANQLSLLLTLQGKKFTVFERNHPIYKRSFEFKTVSDGVHYGLNQKKKTEIDYDGWVYDLEIEKTHNFVCGIGNVVCHNTHVDRSITGPAVFVMTNVVGTQVLLDAALKYKVKRFHHISTDEVFGSLKLGSTEKFNEQTLFQPNSPYSASKAGSDHLVRAYYQTYGLPVTITNTSNNYGPYQFPEKLIPLAVTNLLEGKPVPVYGDGKNVRDWLYVADHCRAIDLVLQKGKVGETYCIGGLTEDISNLAIVKKILKIMGKSGDLIEFVTDRPGHDRRYALDWTKAKNELGYQPEYDFDAYLAQTIDWYKNNRSWWQPIKHA